MQHYLRNSGIPKFFSTPNYIGYFGKHYIGVVYVTNAGYAAFILVFLRKLILKLDFMGEAFVEIVAKIFLAELRKVIRFEKVNIL